MSNWVYSVPQIQDGIDTVSASALNSPLGALTTRTQYLYDRLQSASSGARLVALAQPVAAGSGVAQNSVVYFDGVSQATPGIKLASPKLANLDTHPFFRGANSAYVYGIAITGVVSGAVDVCLQGVITSESDIVAALLDTADPTFVCGPLYLSAKEAGKLTQIPNGLAIYVGYAKSRNEFYLNPNQETLSELFWSFRYAILDRPAAELAFNGSVWVLQAGDTQKVGWINASEKATTDELNAMFPNIGHPKYFYQLPITAINSTTNPELTVGELAAANNLQRALPARPNAFSFLSVNGVVYSPKVTTEDRSSYILNDVGLWWFCDTYDSSFDDGEFDQPWASDLATSLQVDTAQTAAGLIYLKDAEGQAITGLNALASSAFAVGHTLKFVAGSGGAIPGELNSAYTYRIKAISADHFTVYLDGDSGLTQIAVSAGTAPWYVKWQPDFWLIGKGSTFSRPQMNLQFTKLNPDIRQNLVTSLQADPAVSQPAITVSDLVTGEASIVGDLKLKLNIPVVNGWDGVTTVNAGTAVKAVRYNQTTEQLELSLGPTISSIVNGGGLKVSTDAATGVCTISFSNASANAVTDLEPEQARLEYYGLNSYLALDYTTTPNGFVGKFILPDQIISGGSNTLNLILFLFGKINATNAKTLRFKFEYSIGKLGVTLTPNVKSSTVDWTLPVTTGAVYEQYKVQETPAGLFSIPITELAGKATVNFRIHRLRTEPSANLYTGVTGISGVYWTLS